MSQAISKQVIPEIDATGSKHRLIILKDGIPSKSDWSPAKAVGMYDGIYFHIGAAGETIPTVFRVSAVAAEVL